MQRLRDNGIKDKIEPLNHLIRREMAAVDTYNQALDTVINEPIASDLHAILVEHRTAAQALRQYVNRQGGTPASGPGTWRGAQVIDNSVKPLGPAATFQALMEGEEDGIKEYEEVLQEAGLDQQGRSLIASILIPKTRSHISILDRFLHSRGRWS
jgi:hypothetical protein